MTFGPPSMQKYQAGDEYDDVVGSKKPDMAYLIKLTPAHELKIVIVFISIINENNNSINVVFNSKVLSLIARALQLLDCKR